MQHVVLRFKVVTAPPAAVQEWIPDASHVKPAGWDVPQRIADPKVRSAAAITVALRGAL